MSHVPRPPHTLTPPPCVGPSGIVRASAVLPASCVQRPAHGQMQAQRPPTSTARLAAERCAGFSPPRDVLQSRSEAFSRASSTSPALHYRWTRRGDDFGQRRCQCWRCPRWTREVATRNSGRRQKAVEFSRRFFTIFFTLPELFRGVTSHALQSLMLGKINLLEFVPVVWCSFSRRVCGVSPAVCTDIATHGHEHRHRLAQMRTLSRSCERGRLSYSLRSKQRYE